jgi:hypothetical protein
MLEICMSVWPKALPATPSLSSSEGALVSVSISVDPHYLEALLEALSQVSFPINPQIYHDAAIVYRYADDREETESTTLVEFPAYAQRLDEVRGALRANGFDAACMEVTGMLEEIQSASQTEPAPPGSAWLSSYRVKRRTAAVH